MGRMLLSLRVTVREQHPSQSCVVGSMSLCQMAQGESTDASGATG